MNRPNFPTPAEVNDAARAFVNAPADSDEFRQAVRTLKRTARRYRQLEQPARWKLLVIKLLKWWKR